MPQPPQQASAPPQPAAWQAPLTAALLTLCAAVSLLWLVHGWGYLEDDAWIHLEFARSIAHGQGFSFNGHVVYGDTAPLWAWLLAATHTFIPRWETAAKLLDLAGAVFAFTGLWAFARTLTRTLPAPASRLFAAVAITIFVASPYYGYWAFSGMEAFTACGLAAWACALVARQHLRPAVFLLVALMAGIAPLLRPEMGFLSLLLGITLLIRLLRMSQLTAAQKLALFLAGLLLLCVPFGLWARYALHTFGSVLPTTNAAKRANPHDSVARQLISTYGFGFPLAEIGTVLLAIWAILCLLRSRTAALRSLASRLGIAALLILLWTAINTTFYLVNHTYVQTRYIFVTAPLLLIALLAAAALRWSRLYRAAVVFGLFAGIFFSVRATWPLIRNKVLLNQTGAQLSAVLRTLPPDAPVAVYAIGQYAFLSQHPIIDTGGITRPSIIPYLADPTDERQVAWARSQGARYRIGAMPGPDAQLVWRATIHPLGWYLKRSTYDLPEPLELWQIPPGPSDPATMPVPQ